MPDHPMLTVFRAGALVDLDVREVVDSDLAPSVFALAIAHELDHASQRHRHASGQLYCLKQGVMVVGTETGLLANPPHFVGWIPPYFEHSIAGPGALEGWTVFVAQADCAGLPPQPALLSCSALLEPLVERLAGFAPTQWQQPEYQRMTAVLLDELRGAGIRAPSLPLPDERRLRAIATVLIDNPGDPRGGPELARWAGLSPRSLSRHWMQAVGMSLAKYRQVARVMKSLDGLSRGRDVQQVAWDVGFGSVSAYIHAFKAAFGCTPGRYVAEGGSAPR